MIVPWVIRAILHTISLLLTGGAGFWTGVPGVTRTIADEWTKRACEIGFPSQYDSALYRILQVAAFATFLVGWILLSYVTVWIVNRLIF